MQKEDKPINSARSLGKALGVTHHTISAWREKFGDLAPKTYDVAEWQRFIEEQGLGGANNRVSGDREFWLTKASEHRAKLLELEEKRKKRETVLKADLDARDMRVATAQKQALYEILTGELPVKCEGKSALEIRVMNREAADRICVVMQERLNEWVESDDEK